MQYFIHIISQNMLFLALLPRLTRWGSGLIRDREVLRKLSETCNHDDEDLSENVFEERTQTKKKTTRVRISYWSDVEDVMNTVQSR